MKIARGISLAVLVLVAVLVASLLTGRDDAIRVGSKNFNEGYILAEIVAQTLEAEGFRVEREFGLGGTMVCYQALVGGDIDVYPEYTGTISQAILQLDQPVDDETLRQRLDGEHGLDLLSPLGFNNTYAIALPRARSLSLGVRTIGDLARHSDLSLAFSHEFLERGDGWPGLKTTYALPHRPVGIEHGLAYQAIADGKIDVTDVYSTDGDIEKYGLVLLADDRDYFPRYLAAPLARATLDPLARAALERLAGTIDDASMRAMNASVLLDGLTFAQVANVFLEHVGIDTAGHEGKGRWSVLLARTTRHLQLTLIALMLAMAVAIPCGILAYRSRRLSRPVVYVAGALQTIPSIALLAFMIPLFGIGALPAIVALLLYGLLPILRNTTAALVSVDPVVKRVAEGMGLTPWQRLRYVELPLAAPTILAGVKTAAVINIGTATLAAFIGAGGLGEPIVTGLALNDTALILEGAVPAAILAILTELAFEVIDRAVVPRHLARP